MSTKQVEVRHQDLREDDRIITVHGGGQFLVEREIEEVSYPIGTIGIVRDDDTGSPVDGAPVVRRENGWYNTTTNAHEWGVRAADRFFSDLSDPSNIIYTPDEQEDDE